MEGKEKTKYEQIEAEMESKDGTFTLDDTEIEEGIYSKSIKEAQESKK